MTRCIQLTSLSYAVYEVPFILLHKDKELQKSGVWVLVFFVFVFDWLVFCGFFWLVGERNTFPPPSPIFSFSLLFPTSSNLQETGVRKLRFPTMVSETEQKTNAPVALQVQNPYTCIPWTYTTKVPVRAEWITPTQERPYQISLVSLYLPIAYLENNILCASFGSGLARLFKVRQISDSVLRHSQSSSLP